MDEDIILLMAQLVSGPYLTSFLSRRVNSWHTVCHPYTGEHRLGMTIEALRVVVLARKTKRHEAKTNKKIRETSTRQSAARNREERK